MEKTTEPDAVNALIAESALQQKSIESKISTEWKSSTKSLKPRIPKSQSLRVSKKPSSAPLSNFPNNSKSDTSNADVRLTEFMKGVRSTTIQGEEHYYDREAHRQYTLEEIGGVMGVTRERVRQVEEVALRKMWRAFDSMSRRENISPDEWIQILTDSHAGEDTVYLPS
jgi:hypothetical protein